MKGARLIHDIPANTYASNKLAINALYSYYQLLNNNEKLSTFVKRGDMILKLADKDGIFNNTSWYISSSNGNIIQQTFIAMLQLGTFTYSEISSNNSTLRTFDVSNNSQSTSYSLYSI